MKDIQIHYNANFFGDRPIDLVECDEFKTTAFRYPTGVCGLQVQNQFCRFVLLPFHGHQIWLATFHGKNLTMKSIFDMPLDTKKFGDNYGAFLLHCGLSAMGNPGPTDSHPLHGELPTALFTDNYVRIAEDEEGWFMGIGGTFNYKNSQEFNYTYQPEIRLYEGKSIANLHVKVKNLRQNPMKYMCMYHINWLAVEGSRIAASVPHGKAHQIVDIMDLGDDSPRAKTVLEYSMKLREHPEIGDVLDSTTQVYDPEVCTDMRFIGDEKNWAHALQIMPDGDACYVGWRRDELPNGLRWVCRTGDEDGIGIALPNTGNHMGYTYAKKHNLLREIPAQGEISMRVDFGYLKKHDARIVEQHIHTIIGEHHVH